MTVVALAAADRERWAALAARCPDATVFHHPAWVDALRAAHGYEPVVLGHLDAGGELDGVLPLMSRHGWVTGRRLVSLPHTPVAGPAGAGAGAMASSAQEWADARGERLVLKTRGGAFDGADGLSPGSSSTTFVLALPADPDELRFGSARNHRRIRWAVGKAGKEGVAVREAQSPADLRAWHALYLETMRAHAIPPRPHRFFAALWEHLRPAGLMRLLLAERGGTLLAGSVILSFGSTAFYAYNGRRSEALALRPNDLIQWHAIHDAAAAGMRRYDFGEVEDHQRGLAEFKAKWGAEPEPLVRHVHPPSRAMPRTPAAPRARRLGEAAWRHVPLDATARVGDLVYGRL